MRLDVLVRLLFALYCVEAGLLLTFVPWMPIWDRTWILLAPSFARQALLSPWGRGAVTGFGLVHLVWGAHELRQWLGSRPDAPSSTS